MVQMIAIKQHTLLYFPLLLSSMRSPHVCSF